LLDVSVIIPSFNDIDELDLCVDALLAQEHPPSFEIIVVDNGSRYPIDLIVERFPCVKVLRETKTGSYAARNAGIACASGEILAFTDADCRPARNWLQTGVHRLRAADATGLAGRVLLTTDSKPSIAEAYELLFAFAQRENVRSGYSVTANLFVWKRIVDQAGGFDDRLFSSGDYEWCIRAAAHGLRLMYDESLVVNHRARATLAELTKKRRRVEGGQTTIDINKFGKARAAVKGLRPKVPSRVRLVEMLRNPEFGFAVKLRLLFLILWLAGVSAVERNRVLLGGVPKRS
jgi:glycosyltransferase involved in cell wall biosynthesis